MVVTAETSYQREQQESYKHNSGDVEITSFFIPIDTKDEPFSFLSCRVSIHAGSRSGGPSGVRWMDDLSFKLMAMETISKAEGCRK